MGLSKEEVWGEFEARRDSIGRKVGGSGLAEHLVINEEVAGAGAAVLRQDPVGGIGHDGGFA